MRFSISFHAKTFKAELKAAGIKVLRCKQYADHALVTIANTPDNQELFENFARKNNFAGVCDMELTHRATKDIYLDYGNVFKYREPYNAKN